MNFVTICLFISSYTRLLETLGSHENTTFQSITFEKMNISMIPCSNESKVPSLLNCAFECLQSSIDVNESCYECDAISYNDEICKLGFKTVSGYPESDGLIYSSHVSRESSTDDEFQSTKIAVSGDSDTIEILDIEDPTFSCILPKLPLHLNDASLIFVQGKLALCSPGSEDTTFGKLCYKLRNNRSWTIKSIFTYGRMRTRPIYVPNLGWLFGGGSGYVSELNPTSTTVILKHFQGLEKGPDLPGPRFRHCFVQFNLTHTILIGGGVKHGHYNSKTAYYMDWSALDDPKSWIPIPDVHHAIGSHSCGKYLSEVIYAGGWTNRVSNYTGVMDFGSFPLTWKKGPDFPKPCYIGQMVNVKGRLISLGGICDNEPVNSLYEYTPIQWKLLSNQLQSKRENPSSLRVPNSFVNQFCTP